MQISVADIVRTKTNRQVPKGIIRWLERLIHQDECNAFLNQYGHLRNFDFLEAFLSEGLHETYQIHSLPHRPTSSRPMLFVSNHPLGGLDGIILLLALHHAGYQPKAIVNDLLLHIEPIRDLFVPVNKVGAQAREYVEKQQQLWLSDADILSFPAGACSRMQQGQISDLEWKSTFIRNAVRYQRDVVPIYFDATNSNRFYRIAQLRRWLRCKVNVEMLFLPDEMFRATKKCFHAYVGQPIPWQTFDASRTMPQWAEYVKNKVYEIRH